MRVVPPDVLADALGPQLSALLTVGRPVA